MLGELGLGDESDFQRALNEINSNRREGGGGGRAGEKIMMLYVTGFCLQGAIMRRGQAHHWDTHPFVDPPDIAVRDCLLKMSSKPHSSITA